MSDDKIKRYDCTNGGYAYCAGCYTMREEDNGEYVEWEDYEALLEKYDTLKRVFDATRKSPVRFG